MSDYNQVILYTNGACMGTRVRKESKQTMRKRSGPTCCTRSWSTPLGLPTEVW